MNKIPLAFFGRVIFVDDTDTRLDPFFLERGIDKEVFFEKFLEVCTKLAEADKESVVGYDFDLEDGFTCYVTSIDPDFMNYTILNGTLDSLGDSEESHTFERWATFLCFYRFPSSCLEKPIDTDSTPVTIQSN